MNKPMNKPMNKNTSLVLATIAAISASPLFLVQPTRAEEKTPQEVNQPQIEESRDEFNYTQGDYDQPFNPFEHIHRANLGGGRSMSDFRQQQQQNFNDAAAAFRAQQQELLRQERQATPINSEPVNQPEATSDQNNLTESEVEDN
jgi:hypothetical protein